MRIQTDHPGDLVTFVPYLLGHCPRGSLVLVGADPSGLITGATQIQTGNLDWGCGTLATAVGRILAAPATITPVVLEPHKPATGTHSDFFTVLQRDLAQHGIQLDAPIRATGTYPGARWSRGARQGVAPDLVETRARQTRDDDSDHERQAARAVLTTPIEAGQPYRVQDEAALITRAAAARKYVRRGVHQAGALVLPGDRDIGLLVAALDHPAGYDAALHDLVEKPAACRDLWTFTVAAVGEGERARPAALAAAAHYLVPDYPTTLYVRELLSLSGGCSPDAPDPDLSALLRDVVRTGTSVDEATAALRAHIAYRRHR